MRVNDPEFQNHALFDELDRYVTFYESLANSVFSWVTQGTRALGNIDSYVYSSIQGTLSSIVVILRNGRINDAYALLRMYFDSATINIYSLLYLDEHISLGSFVVTQIDNWLKGRDKLPDFGFMARYIRKSSTVKAITDILLADDRYMRLRNRCNDHTHYNFFGNVLLNDNEIHLPHRGRSLDEFLVDLRDIFAFHIAYVFCVREIYMMSSDYRDSLEVGMTPEPDSQYWVAPFIQEMFDRTLATHRPDLAQCLRAHTSMQIT